MNPSVEQTIAEVAAQHSDRRLHVFRVQVESVHGQRVKLIGRVLEQDNLRALRNALAARHPQLVIDDSAVQLLRRDPPVMHTVATNLTDLHVEPSFLAEMLTQVFCGTELEILDERDRWHFVRQRDGYLGWVYKSYLAATIAHEPPTHVVVSPSVTVRGECSMDSRPITQLLAGSPVHVTEKRDRCARITAPATMLSAGWVALNALRTLPPKPSREQLIADARQFTGVYYLWGGNTAWGLDCSGLVQIVHRMNSVIIPRDADMQFAAGRPVEPPYQPGDLLFFSSSAAGGEGEGRKITHVGLSTGGWNMIHSSRFHNGVYEDDVQARPHLRDSFVAGRSFVER